MALTSLASTLLRTGHLGGGYRFASNAMLCDIATYTLVRGTHSSLILDEKQLLHQSVDAESTRGLYFCRG